MKILRILKRRVLIVISCLACFSFMFSQQESGLAVKRGVRAWQESLAAHPVDPTSHELVRGKSLTNEGKLSNDVFLENAISMGIDPVTKEIFIADKNSNRVFIFSSDGSLLGLFGKKGAGPGDLFTPLALSINSTSICVYEGGNSRLSLYAKDWKYERSIRLFRSYCDIAITEEDSYFAVPLAIRDLNNEGILHQIGRTGILVKAFGTCLSDAKSMPPMWGRIAADLKRRLVYLAYTYLLKVQVYSYEGKFLKEVPIEFEAMRFREKANIKEFQKGTIEAPAYQVIDAIGSTGEGFIVLKTYPRIEFKEYDFRGRLKNSFWHEAEWDIPPGRAFVTFVNEMGKRVFIICFEGKYAPIEIYSEK